MRLAEDADKSSAKMGSRRALRVTTRRRTRLLGAWRGWSCQRQWGPRRLYDAAATFPLCNFHTAQIAARTVLHQVAQRTAPRDLDIAGHFQQWVKHKRTFVQAWMRDCKPFILDLLITVQQYVEIQRSRPPLLAVTYPSVSMLNSLQSI